MNLGGTLEEEHAVNERRTLHSIITYSGSILMLFLLVGMAFLLFVSKFGLFLLILSLAAILCYFFLIINRRILAVDKDRSDFLITLAFSRRSFPIASVFQLSEYEDFNGKRMEILYKVDEAKKKLTMWQRTS